MAESPSAPKREPNRSTHAATGEPELTPKQLQAAAHKRGRICKVRNCKVCAPLREARRLRKAQRKADAQARAHAKGEPCGRANCPVAVCVAAAHADAPATASTASTVRPSADPAATSRPDETDDAGAALRRQAERHRAGLPCGIEDCPSQMCVEGFAQERARRHRARRPCKSAECANPVCAASRSTT